MADQPVRFTSQPLFFPLVGAIIIAVGGVLLWLWITAGRESTDDAQVDAPVTPVSARVGGTVMRVPVKDNQRVDASAVLVELDPRDYQVAIDKARAELADAEASAVAAQSNVPITSTTAASNVSTAEGSVEEAGGGVDAAQKEVGAAHARLTTAQARQREAEANAARTSKDVERLRGLLAKDEVSQQQFEAAVSAAEAQRAATDSAKSQVVEAEAGIRVAESKLLQARAGEQQARAGLRSAQTGPAQVAATRARALAAEAHAQQARASLAQAELNLQYTTIKAAVKGVVSRKTAQIGQVIQPGQPLMALVPYEDVWITANFKETQLQHMRPGQSATVKVDAYGGREYKGHVDSIAAATGSRFSLLPPENATGNFVKVVQRVPVKIVLEPGQDPEHLLRPGLSVAPTVYTK
ncbi:MAG: HlyD family secretion protein [Acidobacteria bacterium]|nr:MAG: HlyD family secretion protein [Acidobacteriota bacterium]